MSADASREAFEAWLQIEQFLDGVTIKETDFARRAWQVSRKLALEDAIQVAQPEDSYQDVWFEAKTDAVNKIKELMK